MSKICKRIIIISLFFLISGCINEPDPIEESIVFTPRSDYDAPLEIRGKIIHGAGQSSPKSFKNYVSVMENHSTLPAIYMDYLFLEEDCTLRINDLKSVLYHYFDKYNIFLIPQIGLAMTWDGDPSSHYEGEVAEGKYDVKIDVICKSLASLGHPFFIRIGYEFNGKNWNGYEPDTYKKAFIRVTEALRRHNLDAATVWCAAAVDGTQKTIWIFIPGTIMLIGGP